MDAIREQFKNPLVVGAAGLVVGILFGLVVLGWWLFPVKWVNARPQDLSYSAKVEYLRMAVEAYAQTGNAEKARERYESLGPDASKALDDVLSSPEGLSPQVIQSFGTTVLAQVPPGVTSTLAPGATPPATEAVATGGTTGGFLRTLLTALCVIVLVAAAILVVVFVLRNRGTSVTSKTPAFQAQKAAREAEWTDYASTGEEPPMARFMASYQLGDDAFNDSFGIESPSGEYLGECGVDISETIVGADPKKVTAFEVWLFDKNDYQTVTKVLMSEHAFSDPGARQRLAAKGEPILVVPDATTELDTQSLRLVAHVVDMAYGNGALPQSFFERFILELSVWVERPSQKPMES